MQEPVDGGCTFYIKRKQRYCHNKQTLGSAFCTNHRINELSQTKKPASDITISTGRKQNLARPPKRMLNPFFIQSTIEKPLWTEIFPVPQKLFLDIGSAKGKYLLQHSQRSKHINHVGVELFGQLVKTCTNDTNLYYISGNIKNSFDSMDLPNLYLVSILFPDPNKKRRLVSKEFCQKIGHALLKDGLVYFASDWHELALEIRNCFLSTGMFYIPTFDHQKSIEKVIEDAENDVECKFPYVPTITPNELNKHKIIDERLIDVKKDFEKPFQGDGLWLKGIPLGGVMSERDLVCETQWRSVYRLVLFRK